MIEPPAADARRDLGGIGYDVRRREHAAVIGAAGARPVLVDGAPAVFEHRTVAAVVVPHHALPGREARCGKEHVARDDGERLPLISADVDELRGSAAGRALAAWDIGVTLAAEGSPGVGEPVAEAARRERLSLSRRRDGSPSPRRAPACPRPRSRP